MAELQVKHIRAATLLVEGLALPRHVKAKLVLALPAASLQAVFVDIINSLRCVERRFAMMSYDVLAAKYPVIFLNARHQVVRALYDSISLAIAHDGGSGWRTLGPSLLNLHYLDKPWPVRLYHRVKQILRVIRRKGGQF